MRVRFLVLWPCFTVFLLWLGACRPSPPPVEHLVLDSTSSQQMVWPRKLGLPSDTALPASFVVSGDRLWIQFGAEMRCTWSLSREDFVHDDGFAELRGRFKALRAELIGHILDTVVTPARVACYPENLRLGQLAFLLLDALYPFPYFQATGMQWDVLDPKCPHPLGMLEGVYLGRLEIKHHLLAYFRGL